MENKKGGNNVNLEKTGKRLDMSTFENKEQFVENDDSTCNENDFWIQQKNIGAKVFSARLAKVLYLFISSMTTRFCNAIEHGAKSGEIRQRTTNRDKSGGSRYYPHYEKLNG